MNKKYIMFDLDGTISDPKTGITKSVQYSLKSFGIEISDINELTPFIGPPLRDSYKKFYGFNDSEAETAVAKYREYFTKNGIFENMLYDGMAVLLKSLKALDKTLIVATSKPAVYASQILDYFNIGEYFSFVSGSELDGTRSKKAEVIEFAMKNCGIKSTDDVIMVGDREHDILGAKELGIESVGVLYGYGSRGELLNAGADFIVDSVDGLLRLLALE